MSLAVNADNISEMVSWKKSLDQGRKGAAVTSLPVTSAALALVTCPHLGAPGHEVLEVSHVGHQLPPAPALPVSGRWLGSRSGSSLEG